MILGAPKVTIASSSWHAIRPAGRCVGGPEFGNAFFDDERELHLPPRLIRCLSVTRRHGDTDAPRRFASRTTWLSGLVIFIASVAIAAILPRADDTPAPAGLTPSPPPRTIQSGETTRPDAAMPASAPATPNSGASPTAVWTEVTVRRGDTLSDILRREGYDSAGISQAVSANPRARTLQLLHPGETLRLRAAGGAGLAELVYQPAPGEVVRLVRQQDRFDVTRETLALENRIAYVSGTIESSLFEDGQNAGLSDALVMKLVEIFGWDIDFALDLRRGDSFAVIYEEKYWQGQKISDGAILAAEFVNQGQVYRAIGHRDATGNIAYYAPDGTSLRRSFLRTPVQFSRISSRFTAGRYHPILKTWRAHKGVDYAAPVGTPVRATSAGRIQSLGWNGGYGKSIVIRHNATYSTVYGHLSRYAGKLHVGSSVEQGQVIGYVGATGLATGPHLHYEFLVNGEHRNPLTDHFPAAAPIAAEYRDDFAESARTWSARLDLIGRDNQVASGK
jgi:murein DD-endopeptidase MepM/ murein hydrolase activator NlpD